MITEPQIASELHQSGAHARARKIKADWDAAHAAERATAKAAWRKKNKWQNWASTCLNSKRSAGQEVTITWGDLASILERQGYVCALTGLPFWKAKKIPGAVSWDSPSMDRIEPGGPYSAENVRVVLHCINTFRGRLTDQQMVLIARCLVRTVLNSPQALRRHKRAPDTKKVLYPKQGKATA